VDSERDIRFTPLQRAGPRYLVPAILAGPLLWLGGLLAVAYVANRGDEIALALAIAGASFVLALLFVVPARIKRDRRESAE